MKKHILFVLFLFVLQTGWSRSPVTSYFLIAPDFENLLPFSEEELALFKKQKVKTIRKEVYPKIYDFFHFNSNGQLYKVERKGRFGMSFSLDEYKYDEKGNVIVVKKNDGYKVNYDSICYDSNNRISSYYKTWSNVDKKQIDENDVFYNLKRISVGEHTNVFVDSSRNEVTYYELNKDDIVVKKSTSLRIDSIAFIEDADGYYTKINYFKRLRFDSTFYVGEKNIYIDNRLVETQVFSFTSYSDNRYKERYTFLYSQDGKLVYSENDNRYRSKFYYFYTFEGLLSKRVEYVRGKHSSAIEYKYTFFDS